VEGEKLSSTATHAQGNQDYTQVNVSRNTTPSRKISNENSSWGEGNIAKNVKKECQSDNFVCIYTVIIKITHFHKSCVV
jgi:hypothetical protein